MDERPLQSPAALPLLSSEAHPLPPILLRNSINLLAGAPGAGKTALVAWMTTRFRDTLPIFGFAPTPGIFQGFIGADRSWNDSTHLWFDTAGYPDIPHYSLLDDASFNVTRLRKRGERMGILHSCFDALDTQAPGGHIPSGSLVWIDPISLFLGGNLLDYDACVTGCIEIHRLCKDRDLTVVGLAHAGKQKADKAQRYLRLQDRIVGSTAQFGFTDTMMYLAEPLEVGEDFSVFHWHPHHAAASSFKLLRDPATGLLLPDHAEPLTGLPASVPDEPVVAAILACLPESPTLGTLSDLRQALTYQEVPASLATVKRALQRLLEARRVVRVGHGRYTKPRPS